MKLIPIQSISDIITNSSSEVFLAYNTEEVKNFLNSIGVSYVEFNTYDDVRKYIKEYSAWNLDEALDWNPYANQDWFIEGLLSYHTEDEIWEFFKCMYTPLLGKLFITEDRDWFYNQLDTQEKYETFNKYRI